MLKPLIILHFFVFLFVSQDSLGKETIVKKWLKLDQLITNEIDMIEGLQATGPTMKFRLFELYSEKLKIEKEKENRQFIKGKTGIKKGSFSRSNKLFNKAQKVGLNIEKKHPTYSQIGEVYYILAINSRDYDQGKKTPHYLHLALGEKNLSRDVKHNVRTALAEHYYNSKKYQKAIYYYKRITDRKGDQWRAKHYYNLAWCQFKKKQQKGAIKSLYSAYKLSKLKTILSVEEEVLDAMSIFHINGGSVNEVIKFYNEKLKNPTEYLLKLAQRSSKKGLKAATKKALKHALLAAKRNKSLVDEQEVRLESLYIFRSFGDKKNYFQNTFGLMGLNKLAPLKGVLRNSIIEEISSYTGFIQERFIKEFHNKNENYDTVKLKRITSYFNILISIHPEKASIYRYFQGETFYSIKKYIKAANHYIRGIKAYSKNKLIKAKTKRKILDALISSIAESSLKGRKQKKYLKYAYSNYILNFPREDRTRQIMPKLSQLYLSEKNVTNAQDILNKYIVNFPKDIEIQRGVQSNIINFHVAMKNSYALADWIKRMKGGHLSFDSKYQKQAMLILGDMLFVQIKKEEKESIIKAIHGNKRLYEDEKYPLQIREEAAHNISILFLNSHNTEDSREWVSNGNLIRPHSKKQVLRDQHKSMVVQYYMLQDFKSAYSLSSNIIETFCNEAYSSKEQFFKQHIYISALTLSAKKLALEFKKYKNCHYSKGFFTRTINEARERLFMLKRYRHYNYLSKYTKTMNDSLAYRLSKNLYWESRVNKNIKDEKNALTILRRLTRSDILKSEERAQVIAILEYMAFENKVNKWISSKYQYIDKVFDEIQFNRNLELRFSELDRITNTSQLNIEQDIPNITIGSYSILSESYARIGNELMKLKIKHSDIGFVKSLTSQMKKLGVGLLKKSNDYNNMASELLEGHHLITPYNQIIAARKLKFPVHNFYPATAKLITFDAK